LINKLKKLYELGIRIMHTKCIIWIFNTYIGYAIPFSIKEWKRWTFDEGDGDGGGWWQCTNGGMNEKGKHNSIS